MRTPSVILSSHINVEQWLGFVYSYNETVKHKTLGFGTKHIEVFVPLWGWDIRSYIIQPFNLLNFLYCYELELSKDFYLCYRVCIVSSLNDYLVVILYFDPYFKCIPKLKMFHNILMVLKGNGNKDQIPHSKFVSQTTLGKLLMTKLLNQEQKSVVTGKSNLNTYIEIEFHWNNTDRA